jgi:hypothetical protein
MNAYKLGLILVFSNRLVEAYNLLLIQLTWIYDLKELIVRTPLGVLSIKLRLQASEEGVL